MPQPDHYTGPSDHARDRNVQAGAACGTGVLLVNLGTPAAPTARALKPYLAEFLSDRRVIDYPRWRWWPILKVILAIRPRRSAHAYTRIWTEAGSPLRVLSEALATALQAELAGQARVALAMRYGAPSVATKIAELQAAGVRRLLVLPLYPQYSATSTGSVIDAVADALKQLRWPPELRLVNDYHDDPLHIEALAERIERWWQAHGRGEKLLLSFHGIPERYVRLGDPYLAQCQATAARLRARLGLDEAQVLLSFQSRVGREPWLQPYTDATVRRLAAEGVRQLDVACPGFAVDCLETLEEIAMQNRDFFLAAGGQDLRYIPALNDSPEQVAGLAAIVRRHAQGWPGFGA
ncbi:ferrochelatase [Frateuria terrea]|uniref:Ferrochelatase n=1 Tax=Frateuria terrea TaxID=529704 RepID=A0A1H6X027_9GAMM|nr:ferrochelatase [Frateuria terrea]SEJ19947.1 ferrochelatase [Frateuria terrea]SFP57618.1 ferrochelatase [Frateuria terrea]